MVSPAPAFVHSQSDDSFHTSASSLPPFSRTSSSSARSTPQPPPPPAHRSSSSSSTAASSSTVNLADGPDLTTSEKLELVLKKLAIEAKIKDGAENLLQVLEADQTSTERSDLRREVESELVAANRKISLLNIELAELKSSPDVSKGLRKKASLQALASSNLNSSQSSFAPPKLSTRRLPSANSITPSSHQTPTSSTSAGGGFGAAGEIGGSGSRRRRPSSPFGDEVFQRTLAQARLLLSQLQPPSSQDLSPPPPSTAEIINISNSLVGIIKTNLRVRWELGRTGSNVDSVLDLLSEEGTLELRAVGYRILRWLLVDQDGWSKLEERGVGWYLLRTFSRDQKQVIEKVQALKLVRRVIDLSLTSFPTTSTGTGTSSGKGTSRLRVPLGDTIVRTLVSVAENADDSFRLVVLETLAEIAVIDVSLLLRSNALRVLLQCFSEGPSSLSPSIALVFLHIADSPTTRAALRPGSDIEMALNGFTDVYGSGDAHLGRLKGSSKVVKTLLKSWTGVLYLSMNGGQGIRSLVESLRIPSLSTRECLIDLFFEVLRIKLPGWYHAFLDDRRLTMYSKNGRMASSDDQVDGDDKPLDKITLIDHYVAFLLSVFLKAGLVDALVDVIEEADNVLSRKATFLIGEVLALANKLLPGSTAADAQALPRLFTKAANLDAPLQKNQAITALSSIHRLNRTRLKNRPTFLATSRTDNRARSSSVTDPSTKGQRQVENVRIRLGWQVDDRHYQLMLNETGVLTSRDHTKWNYDVVLEVLQGPLLNPRRLEEALKASKFGRRLLAFFQPLNLRFSAVKKTKPNLKWIRLGCTLITTLLANPDGIAFLSADKLLPQLFECLTELDQYQGSVKSNPFLSKERYAETLSSGYFEMFGTLSRHPEGVKLLERTRLFTLFYHLSDLRSREDLVKAIIDNLDYTTDGHSRIVLSKALTSSYMHIRLYATQRLGDLVLSSNEVNEWTLQLLITQLYDPSSEVCEMAVHFLEEACESTEALELVVQMRPFLDHLGEMGHPLLLRFLSTSVGFQYLRQVQYLDQEMELWFHDRNQLYAVQVEAYIASVLFPDENEDPDDHIVFDGTAPPHFYGELTKTAEGCQMLEEKGHFAEFAQFIRQHGLEASDADVINKLKSILWAVGSIGSTRGGLPFLEEEDLLETIVEIAEESPVLSVRGTVYYVLGLISCTSAGADFLLEFGWEATLSSTGEPTGLCVPSDPAKLAFIPPWTVQEFGDPGSFDIQPCSSALERSVLLAIGNLSNHVQASSSFAALYRLKRTHREMFTSIPLFYRALHIISTNHHRLPIRRFLFELFDIQLTPEVISSLRSTASALKVPLSSSPVPPLSETPGVGDGRKEAAEFVADGQKGATFSTLDVMGSVVESPTSIAGVEKPVEMPAKKRLVGGFGSDRIAV